MVAKKRATTKAKAPAKKTTTKKVVSRTRKAKSAQMRSFRISKPETPFLTFIITRQTLYWSILSILVLGLGLWIVNLQLRVNEIYDQIEANQMSQYYETPKKQAPKQ